LQDELGADGLQVVAIALDESVDAVRPLTEGVSLPVLIDREHLVTELLAISNVPTVVWVDEHDRIVRPNASEMGSDLFVEFTGISSEAHKHEVRAWVRDGVVPEDAAAAVPDLGPDEVQARLHFRLGVHLRRAGDDAGATRHLDAAIALTPLDFTIARAAMPLQGRNPFGAEFMELYARWQDAGSPYHGIARRPSDAHEHGATGE
jgi:hypothetical protein